MRDSDRASLRSNRVYIVNNVRDVETVLQCLNQDNILTEDMIESILVKPTRMAKVGALLDLLPRRGVSTFGSFVSALIQSNQSDCARVLNPSSTEPYLASREAKAAPIETDLERERRLRLRSEIKVQLLERQLALKESQLRVYELQDMNTLRARRMQALESYKTRYEASQGPMSSPDPWRNNYGLDEVDN